VLLYIVAAVDEESFVLVVCPCSGCCISSGAVCGVCKGSEGGGVIKEDDVEAEAECEGEDDGGEGGDEGLSESKV